MNDVADADDHAVHQNVRNRCGSSKMRDDDDVDINYCDNNEINNETNNENNNNNNNKHDNNNNYSNDNDIDYNIYS